MTTEPKLEHPAKADARPPGETWRILFLDNAENVELLKGACKDVGYVVVGATTIDEAWAFLEGKDHADVIVCAPHLEEESMFDFLEGVRNSEVHRTTAFLILSLEASGIGSRLDRSTARSGLLLGADEYAVMPEFDAAELIALIRGLQPPVPLLQSAPPEERRRSE